MDRARILHVVEASLGGITRHVMGLASGCRDAGCDTHVLYAPGRMNEPFARGVRETQGVIFEPLEMTDSAIAPANLRAVAAVRRYIRKHGPFEVIHGHSSVGGAVARLAAVGVRGARVIYTPNAIYTLNPYLSPVKRQAFRAIEVALAALTDDVICISPEELEHIQALGIPARKLTLIPHGLEDVPLLPRDEARRRLELPADALVIGNVGYMKKQKDTEMLVHAFAEVRRAGADVLLAMIGVGPLREDVEKLVVTLGLSDVVRLAKSEEARALMPAFDLFAVPSQYETLSYVALEAMTAGLPVVATRETNARLAVTDGENGFVVPAGHPDQFATALLRIVSDPELRRRFGAASRARARDFTLQKSVDATLAVYGLGQSAPAAAPAPVPAETPN